MNVDQVTSLPSDGFTDDELAQYRREGWVLACGILGPQSIEACKQALSDLATGRIAAGQTSLMYEYGQDPAKLTPEQREFHIRKYMDFVEDAPALAMAAMNRRYIRGWTSCSAAGGCCFRRWRW